MSVSGGESQGVYVVSDAEITSGAFRVAPGPAIRVTGMAAETRGVEGGPLTPVYVVTDPAARGVIGGKSVPMSNLTGIRLPAHDLAIPVYVVEDDGQFVTPVVPCSSDLCQNLVAYWTLNETSGLPANSVAGNPTFNVANGTPGTVAGKVATARSFSASNFTASDDLFSLIDTDAQSFAIAFWFKCGASGFMGGPMNVDGGAPGSRSIQTLIVSSQLYFNVFYGAADAIEISLSPYTVNDWNFAILKFDHTTQRIYGSQNGGAWSVSSSALPSPMIVDAARLLRMGNAWGQAYTGSIDEVAFWIDYAPTDDDRDFLYNSGAGVTYADLESYED